MDCSSVFNLQPGQLPVDQGMQHRQHHRQHQHHQHQRQHEIFTRMSTSPLVSPDVPQDDFYRHDPCSGIENWSGFSPDSVLSVQHPGGFEPSLRYTSSPSFSPQNLPFSGGGSVPLFDASHHHHDAIDVSSPMAAKLSIDPGRVNFSPLERCTESSASDWTSDVYFDVPSSFEPEIYFPPLEFPEYHPLSETLTAAPDTTAKPVKTTTGSSPSPPPFFGLACDQGSPTIVVKVEPDHEETPFTNLSDPEEDGNVGADPPYSKLIERALLSAPDMKLPLQKIYNWFEQNTTKGREGSKGWQNSIRHNLSMNAGFVAIREESSNGKKAGNLWRLTDEAIKKGVQSTTRYRKQANQKKGLVPEPPGLQRQRSGAKGGKAAKITTTTTKFRRSSMDELPPTGRYHSIGMSVNAQRQRQRQKQRLRQRQQQHRQQREREQHQHQPPNELYYQRYAPCPTTAMPAFPEPDPAASIESDLGNAFGCTEPPWDPPIFTTDMGGSECLALDIGVWCGKYSTYHSPNELSNELPNGLPHDSGWTTTTTTTTPEISTADLPLGV